jgi:hypothetical protein
MPNRLTGAVVLASGALAAAAFGGAYALAHGEPAAPPSEPRPPSVLTLADDPLGELRPAAALPGLRPPPPPPAPVDPDELEQDEELEPEAPAIPAAPVAPTPAPTPPPAPPASPPPVNFDDSG